MRKAAATLERRLLIEMLRERLSTDGFPRLQMLVIVAVAGVAAFACSVVALRLGIAHMGVRYGVASIAGYLTFVGMVRLWIAWQRGRWEPDGLDAVDVMDAAISSPPDVGIERGVPAMFRGGRSGGGGASNLWDGPAPVRASGAPRPAGGGFSLDLDEAWPVVVAVGCVALALGLVAVVYTIWLAPVLLAEVALDAALVSALYRKLRREDAGTWIGATLRRTWIPALAVVVLMTIAGSALQYAAPEARSIGGVMSSLRSGAAR
jgi:hypothetical protein